MSNDQSITSEQQQVNVSELSDEALDNLISGGAEEMSNTQAWQ